MILFDEVDCTSTIVYTMLFLNIVYEHPTVRAKSIIYIFFYNCQIKFDLSLARGLDYYTGMVFEAVLKGPSSDEKVSGEIRFTNTLN